MRTSPSSFLTHIRREFGRSWDRREHLEEHFGLEVALEVQRLEGVWEGHLTYPYFHPVFSHALMEHLLFAGLRTAVQESKKEAMRGRLGGSVH